jgi:transposase
MERVTLNQKEQRRLMVLNQVGEGKLALSVRQVRRLMAGYRVDGAAALAHGNRGRKPLHALDDSVRQNVVELASTKYAGFNTQHFTEMLAEKERIALSRSTVRRTLRAAGLKSPRKRRAPKHRSRRERCPQEGRMLQIDGSSHDWLEGRGPRFALVGAIDDATGKVPYAVFREQEDSQGYFLLLEGIVAREGIPLALYHDRHSIFEHTENRQESLEEQLQGKKRPTQFGRLMEELGIDSISAHSPQAKGRVERLWGTFQDRLVSELRLAGADNKDAANRVLWDFLPRFNVRFPVPASQVGSVYAQPGAGFAPQEVFCFKYERTVGVDNVVQFGEHRIQIMPTAERGSYARAKVQVHERMDGNLAVYYQGRCLASQPAPLEAPVLRARKMKAALPNMVQADATPLPTSRETFAPIPLEVRPRIPPRPARNHPWNSYISGFSHR